MSRPLAALTGATGFVGGHAAAALATAGWRLRILARSMPRLPLPAGAEPVEVVPGSLADHHALDALVEGAEAVVHVAGAVRARNGSGFLAANRDGAAAVGRAWRNRAPDATFVLVSSLAAREPQLSAYAASKRAGEDALLALAGAGRLRILRPTAVYGAGDRETLRVFRAALWPVQPLMNGPAARVTLVEAGDLARAIVAALDPALPDGIREVTDARTGGYGWAEVARAAVEAVGGTWRPLRVPPTALRAAGAMGDVVAALGLDAPLGGGKVREILHADWSSSAGRQLPPDLWVPRVGIAEGFMLAVRRYGETGLLCGKIS